MKLLITGAAGFVGSHLLDQLGGEHLVYALVKPGQFTPRRRNCIKIELDLNSFPQKHQLPERVDSIIHLAQANAPFPQEGSRLFNVNTLSTQKLLDYGREVGIKCFVFASSGSIYGSGPDPFTETAPAVCNDFYAYSKYASEQMIQHYRKFFHTIILRLFCPYGPGQQNRLIPNLIQRIKSDQPVEIFNEGNPRINPVYISDLVEVFKRSMVCQGNLILNVGGNKIYSIKEISEIIARIYRKKAQYRMSQDKNKIDLTGNITLMEQVMGYSPRVDLAEGITRMKQDG